MSSLVDLRRGVAVTVIVVDNSPVNAPEHEVRGGPMRALANARDAARVARVPAGIAAREVRRAVVIGAGTTGGGIAMCQTAGGRAAAAPTC